MTHQPEGPVDALHGPSDASGAQDDAGARRTGERPSEPIWPSFEAWISRKMNAKVPSWRLGAQSGWDARQPEIDALQAENQALRARLAEVEAQACPGRNDRWGTCECEGGF